jgi:cobalt/nickel transport system ATP-binding protein
MRKVIEIKNLKYAYPDGTPALDAIDLDVCEGETLGIIGPNGAGKSTLLLHFNGILRSGNACIKIFDLEIKDETLSTIRSKVGLVFQDPDNQLFMPTVFDDIAFGPINMGLSKARVNAQVDKALQEVDMIGSELRLSHHLSVGEKKRISIATVLSMNPEILVLDEPSSNLDPGHRRDMINLLKGFKITKIIATHDLDLVAEMCSKVALLDKGKIVALDTTAGILTNKDLLEAHNLEVPYACVLNTLSAQ